MKGVHMAGPTGVKVVRSERCENCKFAERAGGGVECHYWPPAEHRTMIYQNGKDGVSPLMGPVQGMPGAVEPMQKATTSFPRMNPETWCGQWKPHISITN